MLGQRDPREAYRRVDIDARVEGASPAELVHLCYDQIVLSLGSAIEAAQRQDNAAKSHWLTRALSALFALEMGVSGTMPMAGALLQLYRSARTAILDGVQEFDAARLKAVRDDFIEIGAALRTGAASTQAVRQSR